jgi:hypothetical protein
VAQDRTLSRSSRALDCILGKTREDMTPDEENRPDQPNSVPLAVMTAWHSGERHMMAREMPRAAAAIVEAGWAPSCGAQAAFSS